MGFILQIIGSIASIVGIPLAIYFYLRQREAHHYKLRHEIARTLSFQIGEGRNVSTFEVSSVIQSKCREFRSRSDCVTEDEVIEDLAAEAISNPMLESERKREILENLRSLHSHAVAYRILVKPYRYKPVLNYLSERKDLSPEEREEILKERINVKKERRGGELVEPLSTTFGALAAMITLVVATLSLIPDIRERIDSFNEPARLLSGIIFGVLASLLSAFFTMLLRTFRQKEKTARRKQKSNE